LVVVPVEFKMDTNLSAVVKYFSFASLKSGLYMVTLNMEDGSSKTIKAIKK